MNILNKDPSAYQPTKTPHELTDDLHIAARRVLFEHELPEFKEAAFQSLSDALIAFENTFVVRGSV